MFPPTRLCPAHVDPLPAKEKIAVVQTRGFHDDGPPPRHSWQCWHLQWTIWPLRSPSRSTLCLGQPEQDDQKSRHLSILNNSQLRTACSQVKTHIGTMLSIRMVGVGKIMRSSEDLQQKHHTLSKLLTSCFPSSEIFAQLRPSMLTFPANTDFFSFPIPMLDLLLFTKGCRPESKM